MPLFCSKCGHENNDESSNCSSCSNHLGHGPLNAEALLEGRYKILRLLKTGGMGAVYKARDLKLNNICAIKELLPVYGDPEKEKENTEWFNREAKLLAGLDHPNLPNVTDYFMSYKRYYLVMNFIEGKDLETILRLEGRPGLPIEKVLNWSSQILHVLNYLHNLDPPVIYRDIKPSNIMLHKDGRAMLVDFGIARTIHHDSSTVKTAIGTPGYAPEEQCDGIAEPRSDIYSLGATMHHLFTGKRPGYLNHKFSSIRQSNPDFPEELDEIIMKALKDRKEERFSSAKEMLEALKPHIATPEHTGVTTMKIGRRNNLSSHIKSGIIAIIIFILLSFGVKTIIEKIKSRSDPNWINQTSQTTVGLESIYFLDENTGWIAGEKGIILYTKDGGKNWLPQKSNIDGWLYKIYFINSDEGWAAGLEEAGEKDNGIIIHTKDGGSNWEVQHRENDSSFSDVFFFDLETGWATGSGGLILHTKDGGKNWKKQESKTLGHMEDIYFIDENNGWIAGEEKSGEFGWNAIILNTSDGGNNWKKKADLTEGRPYGIYFLDHNKGWITGFGMKGNSFEGFNYHTTDGGITWEEQKPVSTNYLPEKIHFIDEKRGWISGVDKSNMNKISGIILYTEDGGVTWKKYNRGRLPMINEIYFINPDTGWIVADEGIILKYSPPEK